MNEGKTPEEKLLKLIRKKKKTAKGPSGPEQSKSSRTKDGVKKPDRQKIEKYVFRNVNGVLLVCVLCLAGYCLVQLYAFFTRGTPTPVTLDATKKENLSIQFKYWRNRVEKEEFLREIERRNVFQSPWAIKMRGQTAATNFSDLNKELKLVGIVLDDDPKAIVVDLKSGQTLFLSEGEQVNEIFVEMIEEDKVLLLHNGRQIELVK